MIVPAALVVLAIAFLSKFAALGNKKRSNVNMPSVTPQDKVTAEWDAMAGEWDDIASGYRDKFIPIMWEQTGFDDASARKELVVLDFGCGTGLLTESLRNEVSKVISIDVAPKMVEVLSEKVRAGGWDNVEANCAILGQYESMSPDSDSRKLLKSLMGKVDLIVASSVISFIPKEDLQATMKVLVDLLKPNSGLLCHSDWPKGEEAPDGMTEESITDLYKMAGLSKKSIVERSFVMKAEWPTAHILVGVAGKP